MIKSKLISNRVLYEFHRELEEFFEEKKLTRDLILSIDTKSAESDNGNFYWAIIVYDDLVSAEECAIKMNNAHYEGTQEIIERINSNNRRKEYKRRHKKDSI